MKARLTSREIEEEERVRLKAEQADLFLIRERYRRAGGLLYRLISPANPQMEKRPWSLREIESSIDFVLKARAAGHDFFVLKKEEPDGQ